MYVSSSVVSCFSGLILPKPPPVSSPDHGVDHIDLTLLERKRLNPRTNRLPPLRYRDCLPEPPTAVRQSAATSPVLLASSSRTSETEAIDGNDTFMEPRTVNRDRLALRAFRTLRNAFGLFRQFTSHSPPSHDPEANVNMEALSDVADKLQPVLVVSPPESYDPYPNRNAFRLGEWYWNGGAQKSQASFKDLLEIISDPSFLPSDVRDVNWQGIDQDLAQDDWEEDAG
jgi:hypothetical protein